LVSHADWSKDPAKRWLALAVLNTDHRWFVSELVKVEQPSELFPYLQSHLVQAGCILTGFDFPIGIPSAYASKSGIDDFLTSLPLFGHADCNMFYIPAEDPSQINLHRPFYPSKPGHSRRSHL